MGVLRSRFTRVFRSPTALLLVALVGLAPYLWKEAQAQVLLSPTDPDFEQAANWVDQYAEVILSSKRVPSLNDYSHFMGDDTRWEEIMERHVCAAMKWVSDATHPQCEYLINSREPEDEQTPSWYLAWVRSKLPLEPTVRVLEVRYTLLKNGGANYRIRTRLDNLPVTFMRELQDSGSGQWSALQVLWPIGQEQIEDEQQVWVNKLLSGLMPE